MPKASASTTTAIRIIASTTPPPTPSPATAAALIGFPDAPPIDPPPPLDPDPSCQRDPDVIASGQNLRDIFNALSEYANDHRGQFPSDLGTLFASSRNLQVTDFLNPRGDTPAPADGLSQDEQIAWINASTDYLYFRPGRFAANEAVIAYENPSELSAGIHILFANGHVEFRELRWAIETLRRAGIPGVA